MGGTPIREAKAPNLNVDGAMRDEDTFVLGEYDDDEEDILLGESPEREKSSVVAQPRPSNVVLPRGGPTEQPTIINEATPSKYHITRNDTLQGIALRYGLNVSTIYILLLVLRANA